MFIFFFFLAICLFIRAFWLAVDHSPALVCPAGERQNRTSDRREISMRLALRGICKSRERERCRRAPDFRASVSRVFLSLYLSTLPTCVTASESPSDQSDSAPNWSRMHGQPLNKASSRAMEPQRAWEYVVDYTCTLSSYRTCT